ncbi:hypothetical protein HKD37_11G030643 [Glycine soja]|nr:hypothetical protein GmHk_11G031215 [Glycine max]
MYSSGISSECGRHALRVRVIFVREQNLFSARAAFVGGFHERGAGLDGQCSHLVRLQRVPQETQWKREIELSGLQHLVLVDGRNDVVEFHFVGVAYEAGGIVVQEEGNLYRVGELLQPPVLQKEFGRGKLSGIGGAAVSHYGW